MKDIDELNRISGQVVDAAMEVHTALGPGLLESSYQACLSHELKLRGLKSSRRFMTRNSCLTSS